MSLRKLPLLLTVMLVLTGIAGSTYADISSAAVLFLRIAPGARAAGMGEAFVAVADDATATHWNPAGLGTYPLASSWKDTWVPEAYRPLKAVAALKTGRGSDFQAYELWAIAPGGLIRYDNRSWHTKEVFRTRTTQTVSSIVSSYFNVSDEEQLAAIVARVAEVNNPMTLEELTTMRDDVVNALPDDYDQKANIADNFDSVLAAYPACLVNWEKIGKAKQLLADGLKDEKLTNTEADRISFAVERARNRFIPEDIFLPYTTLLDGEPNAIASNGGRLVVGTNEGLLSYNGKSWKRYSTENGLPSNTVLSLFARGSEFYVGTDKGLVVFSGTRVDPVKASESLPNGRVSAIGAENATNVVVAVDNDLYRYDGTNWSNTISYTVVLDDTEEKIARKMSIYGTAKEAASYLTKLKDVRSAIAVVEPSATVQADDDKEVTANVVETEVTETPTTVVDSLATPEVAESAVETAVAIDQPVVDDVVMVEYSGSLPEAGSAIRVPIIAGIKGKVTSIAVQERQIFVGTDFGLLHFDGNKWNLPGYREYNLSKDATVDETVEARGYTSDEQKEQYREAIIAINDITGSTIDSGTTLKLYDNATASRVNLIKPQGAYIFIATADGLRKYDGRRYSRVELKGMDRSNSLYVEAIGDEVWLVSDKRVAIKATNHTDFSLTHVKWLPDLADDVFYDFLSFTTELEGWGTIGFGVTAIYYGTINLTTTNPDVIDTFSPFEIALTGSFGTSLTRKLKGGISAKFIYSRLSDRELATVGNAALGSGTSKGMAIDLGLIYEVSPKLNIAGAVTNLGPNMQYSQKEQADPIPRNLSIGAAYRLINSDYNRLLFTIEVNKSLIGLNDGFKEEAKQLVLNGGVEFVYANLIALRAGYIFDEEGKIKTPTTGIGLTLKDRFKFDFAYIPSNSNLALANTLRMSLGVEI